MLNWFKQKRDDRSQRGTPTAPTAPTAPSTEAVFAAAQVEDEIRGHLIVWRDGSTEEQTDELCALILQSLIPKLQAMNAKHFGGSAGIDRTISGLEQAVSSRDAERSWEAFLTLAERPGANFGTWAI